MGKKDKKQKGEDLAEKDKKLAEEYRRLESSEDSAVEEDKPVEENEPVEDNEKPVEDNEEPVEDNEEPVEDNEEPGEKTGGSSGSDLPPPKKRVSVFRVILTAALVIIAALIVTVAVNVVLNENFTVSFYQIRSDKVSGNIRVVELADLHNKEFGKNNKKLINKIKSLRPDMIVYAGDMMNYRDSDYSVLFDLSDSLSEIAPIYACFGNNEIDQYLFEDKGFKDEWRSHNVNILSNEALDVEVSGSVVQLIAISDDLKQFDMSTNNGKKFIENLEPTNNCRICLTHYPELFLEKLLDRGIDIAFTGHAHGGLIRLPKIGGIYSRGEGFLPKLTAGVVTVRDGAQVVISRGLGSSSIVPRINNRPELVVVDISWY